MSGRRVKALRREFVTIYGTAPMKAERKLETRSAMIGPDGRLTFKDGKRIYWQQMTVTANDKFRAFRKAHRRVA
jgi:hypothetical protein